MTQTHSRERASGKSGTVLETGREAAGQAAKDTGHTAADQAREVADEAAAQTRHVAADLRDIITEQTRDQGERLAESVRRVADELDEMSAGREDSPARTMVTTVASAGRQLADNLAAKGPEGVLREAQDAARRRPGAFLLAAAASGFVVGRLGKSVMNADGAETNSSVASTRPDRKERT